MNADAAQMDVNQERARLNGLSARVIGAAQAVSSALGHGFLEKVYENALAVELAKRHIAFHQQFPLSVRYDGIVVGNYVPDFLVEESLVVEIKAVTSIDRVHRQQCLNYLRACGLRLGLLLNFGRSRLEVGRIVYRF